MSNAVKILPHYTYADYVQWEGKWEVIDGIPYAMSPAPVPKHQILSVNLSSEFRVQIKQCKNCQVLQPVDYRVKDDIILQPDILIVCGVIGEKFLDFPPVLVVEILSPSTALKDRHTKFSIYESQGVRYYLIIDPNLEEVEVYEFFDSQYKMTARGKDISHNFTLDSCSAHIDFKEIWQ